MTITYSLTIDDPLIHENPRQATTLAVFPENSQVLANTLSVFTSLTTSFLSPCTAGTYSIPYEQPRCNNPLAGGVIVGEVFGRSGWC